MTGLSSVRFCGSEFQMWGPKQDKCSMRVSEEECSERDECRHVAVQRGKQDQSLCRTETHTSDFIFNTSEIGSQCSFPGEVLSGGGSVPKE